jgi:hypothetical protein
VPDLNLPLKLWTGPSMAWPPKERLFSCLGLGRFQLLANAASGGDAPLPLGYEGHGKHHYIAVIRQAYASHRLAAIEIE